MSGEIGVDGKGARACDSCIRKRAQWYCAADDAFLCQSCDASVHSANPLARRHERVRLKDESNFKDTNNESVKDVSVPLWFQGFKRKARSLRKPPGRFVKAEEAGPGTLVVPELGTGETSQEENEEEQVLYRVPIYDDHFDSEILTLSSSEEPGAPRNAAYDADTKEVKALLAGFGQDSDDLLPSEADLAEFAADVESLLGGACHNMDGLGMTWHSTLEVKVEEGDGNGHADALFHRGSAHMEDTNFDCDSMAKRKILLNLDYESVMMAWASQRSPWTTGFRPEIGSGGEGWPEMGLDRNVVHGGVGGRVMSQQAAGGREARVTRYREKRRTRLFSKKIRYEVRKLNAEKRPRMKGRFVKRASLFGEVGSGENKNVNVPLLNM